MVFHKSDIPWAETFVDKIPANAHYYLQPEWSKQVEMNELIVSFVKENPTWQISVQTHKFLQIP